MRKLFILGAALLATTSLQAFDSSNSATSNRGMSNRSISNSSQVSSSSDQQLTKDIRGKLSSGMFSKGYEQLSVRVNNGDVTLIGTVPTQSDKDKVEKEVRNMTGVRSLNSQITFADSSSASTTDNKYSKDRFKTPTDQQLNGKIRDNINGWLWDSYPEVILNTGDGIVILEGWVAAPKDQQSLIDTVGKIEGVKSVKSNLQFKDKTQ